MAQIHFSPLRYPGGKSSLYDFIVKVIDYNNLGDGVYAEPFAGGAGLALKLLMQEHVGRILINDKDPFVYLFWKAVLQNNEELIKLIRDTPVTLAEWTKRNELIKDKNIRKKLSDLEIGFTTFFLNRCNRSGILKAGVIGGQEQKGKWKIDARYNKSELINRIYKIGFYNDRIHLYNDDAINFIKRIKSLQYLNIDKTLLYLDPPYVHKGKELYIEYFSTLDHQKFSEYIHSLNTPKWIISYDDVPLIHQLYKKSKKNIIEFNYFANRTKLGKELIISSSNCSLPSFFSHYSKIKKNRGYKSEVLSNAV